MRCGEDGLVGRGASLDEPNKEGLTPLLLASKAGKVEVVKYIIRVQAASDDPSDLVRRRLFGVAGVDKAGKDSWNALHLAVAEGEMDAGHRCPSLHCSCGRRRLRMRAVARRALRFGPGERLVRCSQ